MRTEDKTHVPFAISIGASAGKAIDDPIENLTRMFQRAAEIKGSKVPAIEDVLDFKEYVECLEDKDK